MVSVSDSKKTNHLKDADAFNPASGSLLERLVFNYRRIVLVFCGIITLLFGAGAVHMKVNASYIDMLPSHQQYIKNYEDYKSNLRSLGDSIRIVVQYKNGNIYNNQYLKVLQKINDSVFLLPGVDRSFMTSLWTPSVRWAQITEAGTVGGPVMPDGFNGSPQALKQLEQNVQLANITGKIVANDSQSSAIFVPLLDYNPATGQSFNYGQFWSQVQAIKNKYESDNIKIHVVGFAAVMGTMIAALYKVILFFAIAAIVVSCFIFYFTRCIISTMSIVFCSIIAVIWLLGAIHFCGFSLDPYSILVPFLVFAIGVSHGAQKMNGIMQDIGRGINKYVAARYTFRRLFATGLTALLVDVVGFAVLTVIQIRAIQELAIMASIGVFLLIFTNLILLPIILSYVGVGHAAAVRSLREDKEDRANHGIVSQVFNFLDLFTQKKWAFVAVAFTLLLAVGGFVVGRHVQIGDVQSGAPEFWPNSVYNQDNRYVVSHYSLSSDEFAIIVHGIDPSGRGLVTYPAIVEMDRLGQYLDAVPGVQTTVSAANYVRDYTAAQFSGNLKWWTINRNPYVLSGSINATYADHPDMMSSNYTDAPLIVYLLNHKADTLQRVSNAAEFFINHHNSKKVQFLLAAGNAGFDQATNIVVAKANRMIPYLVYGVIVVLCLFAFRSWRAVIVAIIPLLVTSILCEALMVILGIGIKVATLPVMALGVGIGVDYALYLLSIQLKLQRDGVGLQEAYRRSLRFTGRIVFLVGFTLAVSVSFWAFSPIKFQADMGILLAFMFLWNMVGALFLVPSLSYFLLPNEVFKK